MISVIVPVYNVESYLDRCVQSIVDQTYSDLEIILVDDGSPDRCGSMCDKWAKRDGRIKVVHKENGGLSDARNVGIEIATGDYIGFVDSDDWIEPDMYEKLLKAIQNEDAQISVCGLNRIYDNGYSIDQFVFQDQFTLLTDNIVRAYLCQNTFSTASCDKLYRAELFDVRRFPKGKLYEDAPIIFEILCSINKMVHVGKPLYHYFQRSSSISNRCFSIQKMDHYFFSKDIWKKSLELYPQFKKQADAFWGCKLCELIYAIDESSNKREFQQERSVMKQEFKKVKFSLLSEKEIPLIMKFKVCFIMFNMTNLYINFKRFIVKKGDR